MDIKDKITEQSSRFDHLEQMSVSDLLRHINEEDAEVSEAVRQAIPQIQPFVAGSFILEQEPVDGWESWMPANCLQPSVCQIHG